MSTPSRPYAENADAYVGAQIRARRAALGLTLTQLAAMLGIRHQQLQRYETGDNRISAGFLFLVARALGVDTAFFFRGLSDQPYLPPEVRQAQDVSLRLEDLAQDFLRITNPQYQEALCRLARALAERAEASKDGS